MPVDHVATFNQDTFMKTWTYRDGSDKARNAVIHSGACTVFSIFFLKLVRAGAKPADIAAAFHKELESIVLAQAEGLKAHSANGNGYDAVLKLVGGVKRAGEFEVGGVGMRAGPPEKNETWIHVFTTQFAAFGKTDAAHTIAHVRGNDDNVYTFDPNDGVWRAPAAGWKAWLADVHMKKYPIATGSRFLKIVPA